MIDWKELGQKAIIGAIYGGSAVLAVSQDLNFALLSALAVGVIRGCAQAVIGYLEPKNTASKPFGKETKYEKAKKLF